MQEKLFILASLVVKGLDVNATNKSGKTLLRKAFPNTRLQAMLLSLKAHTRIYDKKLDPKIQSLIRKLVTDNATYSNIISELFTEYITNITIPLNNEDILYAIMLDHLDTDFLGALEKNYYNLSCLGNDFEIESILIHSSIGYNLLQYAIAQSRGIYGIKFLIEKCSFDPFITTNDGKTLVDLAIEYGNNKAVINYLEQKIQS